MNAFCFLFLFWLLPRVRLPDVADSLHARLPWLLGRLKCVYMCVCYRNQSVKCSSCKHYLELEPGTQVRKPGMVAPVGDTPSQDCVGDR